MLVRPMPKIVKEYRIYDVAIFDRNCASAGDPDRGAYCNHLWSVRG